MKHRQGNRGMSFENLINLANRQYKNKGIALIYKRPTPVKVLKSKGTRVLSGFYEAKSTVDYSGIYKGKPIEFEAKSVSGKRFDLKNVHKHQLGYLENAEQHGAVAFLLVEFRDTREVFYTPLSMVRLAVRNAKNGGRKSIPIDDFQIYADEVLQGQGIVLDYLKTVDKHSKALSGA